MKVRFVVTLAAICFALSAFADEAPTAASPTQDAVLVDSDGPTGHQALKDHHAKRCKKRHPKNSDEASPKIAPTSSSVPDGNGILRHPTKRAPATITTRLTAPTEPRLTFQLWNYYAPSLNEKGGGAENIKPKSAR